MVALLTLYLMGCDYFPASLLQPDAGQSLPADTGTFELGSDGPVADGPVADGPVADGPVTDAPLVDAPVVVDALVVDAPAVDAPAVDASPAPCLGKFPKGPFAGIKVEVYTSRKAFRQRLAMCTRLVDFDGIKTGASGSPVAFTKNRYQPKGIIISGQGGQYADETFSYASSYPPVSKPNSYAPGPAATKVGGGFSTTVTFTASGKAAAAAGFGAFFIDADFPTQAQSSLSVLDKAGKVLKKANVSGGNASQLFLGIVTVDASNKPVPAIFSAKLINGDGWPAGKSNEGVTLDDFVFADPVVW